MSTVRKLGFYNYHTLVTQILDQKINKKIINKMLQLKTM